MTRVYRPEPQKRLTRYLPGFVVCVDMPYRPILYLDIKIVDTVDEIITKMMENAND